MVFYLYLALVFIVAAVAAFYHTTSIGGVTKRVRYWSAEAYKAYFAWYFVWLVFCLLLLYLKFAGFFTWLRGVGCGQ